VKKVVAAIIKQEGKVLLTQREDFAFWCLPGGYVEEGESELIAIQREVLEETGFNIVLSHLVIQCTKPLWRGGVVMSIFDAVAKYTMPKEMSPEVLDIGFFSLDNLPYPMLKEHFTYITMPRLSLTPHMSTDYIVSPKELALSKKELRKLMAISCVGMEKAEWYASLFKEPIYL